MRNSTIRLKIGFCSFPGCKYEGELIGGMCQIHYWGTRQLRSVQKREYKEIVKEQGLMDIIERLDALVSQYVRRSAADHAGYVQCYTCPIALPWQQMQAGHYLSRKIMYLRFDIERNIRPQCEKCNCNNHGMQPEFGRQLELEKPGITQILLEDSRPSFKWSRQELNQLVAQFHRKIKTLK